MKIIDLEDSNLCTRVYENKTEEYLCKKGNRILVIPQNDKNTYRFVGGRKSEHILVHLCKKNVHKYYEDYHSSLRLYDIQILYADKADISISDNPGIFYFISFDHRDNQLEIPLSTRNTAYINFEPLYCYDNYRLLRPIYEKGYQLLDYSVSHTMQFPKELHLPYQYDEVEIGNLKMYMQGSPKEYDVAMICNGQPRRQKIQAELEKRGIKVYHIMGWGFVRDYEVSKCRMLLNLHAHEEQMGFVTFEELRCVRWMFAGMKIIAETSVNQEELMVTGIEFVDYDELVDRTVKYIRNLKCSVDDDEPEFVPNEVELQKCARARQEKLQNVLKFLNLS